MPTALSRRAVLAAPLAALGKEPPYTVDSHIHLFDPKKFPYHPSATYRPPAATLEEYLTFAAAAGISKAVIVHPEPYQDDHRYLEHSFAHEKPAGFFKGTCLFDPLDPRTSARMTAIVKANPGRIVALRVHAMNPPGQPFLQSGPIKDRDLGSAGMKTAWKKAADLGLAVQMHFLPHHAPAIGKLAAEIPATVILDHLARFGSGTAADADAVVALGKNPRVVMKFSSPRHSSKTPHPHADVKPFIRRCYEAFGPERIIWGSLGHTVADFRRNEELLAFHFDYATEADRLKIRGKNAQKLFRF